MAVVASVIPKLLRLGLHWGDDGTAAWPAIGTIPKLLRLGLHWGTTSDIKRQADKLIPKLLRLGLHWGGANRTGLRYPLSFLSFYA